MSATHEHIRRGPNRGLVALLVVAALLAIVTPAGAGPNDSPLPRPQLLGIGILNSNVRVTNTAAEPVPVSVMGSPTVGISPGANTVQVAGTPTVGISPGANTVQVAGTPTVGIAGTVPVAVVVPSDRWSAVASLDIGDGSGNTCNNCDDAVLLDVPDGKVAVVEHVSMEMRSTPGAVFDVTLGPGGVLHYVQSAYLDTDALGRRVYAGSQPVTLYVPSLPGATGELAAHAFSIGGLEPSFRTTIQLRVTGYYVDAP